MKKSINRATYWHTALCALITTLLVLFMPTLAHAQDTTNQDTIYVGNNGILYFGGNIINNTAATLTNDGDIVVARDVDFQLGIIDEPNNGIVIFQDGATASSASDSSHVDGLVRKVGDGGQHGPAGISAPGAATDEVEARFWLSNPQTDAGSTLSGTLSGVSTIEYWNISGTPTVNLTLHWDTHSNVAALSGGDVANLHVVGWDGSQWNDLGNDATTGDTTTGSITANGVTPNSYQAYTIGTVYVVNNDVDGDLIPDADEGTGCVGAANAHAPPIVVDTNYLSASFGCIAIDTDNDGVPDSADQCPNTPAGGIVDSTDGCPLDTNLTGTKAASVTSATPGTPFDYTLTVNNGGAETHNVKVIDVVQVGLTINGTPTATNNSSTGGACTVSSQVVTCTWDIMDDGASETITINVTP
ncbi:MAG: hypothetical protein AAF702_26530 [Chloroflexota bacterium]